MILVLGLTIGIAVGIRIMGLLLLGYLSMDWLYRWVRQLRFKNFLRLSTSFLGILAIAWGVMLTGWPWAQMHPILNPLKSIVGATEISKFVFIFDRNPVLTSDLPASYLPSWLALSLPEFYFVALTLGSVLVFQYCFRSRFG